MASSSTSFHSTPASSSFSWNYDVFLSFRGEDTRKTFVDHLDTRLVEHGIHTYKDDRTLPRGESIGPALLKAIQESRIAIVVFSENYADSSWCLDELAYIMKCRDERGQIVLPVFYHVDPSDIRKQKRKYNDAFDNHELENNNKVESWRNALIGAGNLSGWVPKDTANGHESELIKYIVDRVSNTLFSLSSNVNEDLVGMSVRLKELRSQLEVESGGVRMIGIWGMGGSGKTTLASSIYDEISSKFDGCCFLDNIRENSRNDGLKKLQEQVLSDILKENNKKVRRVEEGKHIIRSRLCHKNVLIVLDDVDHLDQLKMLAGSHDWFGEGSRIIITTRDKHLLNAHNVVIYDNRLLNDDEAIKLFCKHAPHQQDYIALEDYKTLSKDVISYACGLPLALQVLGSFLCDKDVNQWRSALTRLKVIPEDDIIGKLKISYDGLKQVEKELFLDIACFHRGRVIEEQMMSLDVCGFHPVIGIKVLIQKALITVSKKLHGLQGMFDMHDLIREMGHYIVQGEHPENPEKHSRVWRKKDILSICSANTTNNDRIVETMAVDCNDYPSSLLPTNFQPTKLRCLVLQKSSLIQLWEGYKNLPNLKVLDVSHSRKLIKTPDLGGLPCLERMILRDCRALREIHSSTGSHERLAYLDLQKSSLRQLWEGYKNLPLPNLKVLDLTGSLNLIKTPDLGGLPCLERMILNDCYALREIHSSTGSHERLAYLDFFRCEMLETFPPITRMPKLATLILSWCSRLCKFPDIQSNMDSLVDIRLDGSGIEVLPSSIAQYCTNLVSLDLIYYRNLTRIEGDFRRLKKLKELNLKYCVNLKTPAQDFINAECCLEVLSLHPMHQLPPPFVNSDCLRFRHLPRFLTHLSLCKSSILVDGYCLRFDISELSSLQVLDLSWNKFSRIHFNLVQLPRLKFLDISCCRNLVELPDLPSSIAVLDANYCDSLKITEDFPTTYKWLWKVSLALEVCGGENVLRSMLQGNAINEDHFISFKWYGFDIPRGLGIDIPKRSFADETFTLQLPLNWYSDYTGFLIGICDSYADVNIIIKQEMHTINHSCLLDDIDGTEIKSMCYIPFSSLMHKPLWNGNISFFIFERVFKVELVPRRSKGGSTKRSTDCSEFWDEEIKDMKTFTIQHAAGNSVKITWLNSPFKV